MNKTHADTVLHSGVHPCANIQGQLSHHELNFSRQVCSFSVSGQLYSTAVSMVVIVIFIPKYEGLKIANGLKDGLKLLRASSFVE